MQQLVASYISRSVTPRWRLDGREISATARDREAEQSMGMVNGSDREIERVCMTTVRGNATGQRRGEQETPVHWQVSIARVHQQLADDVREGPMQVRALMQPAGRKPDTAVSVSSRAKFNVNVAAENDAGKKTQATRLGGLEDRERWCATLVSSSLRSPFSPLPPRTLAYRVLTGHVYTSLFACKYMSYSAPGVRAPARCESRGTKNARGRL